MENRPNLFQMCISFFKIVCTGFGGPYALLILLERELVKEKKWLKAEEFWEGVAIGQITPGPLFFATAVFCGYRMRGLLGATLAAISTTLPGFIMCLGLGYCYVYLNTIPELKQTVPFIIACVVGLLFSFVLKDRKKFFKQPLQYFIGVAALVALLGFHVSPLIVIAAAAIIGILFLTPLVPS